VPPCLIPCFDDPGVAAVEENVVPSHLTVGVVRSLSDPLEIGDYPPAISADLDCHTGGLSLFKAALLPGLHAVLLSS
jgi:hypothetical protein